VARRRAVFDTNVLISGYLWKGVARQAIEKVRQNEWIHLVSNATVDELIRVLAYSKFGLTAAEIGPIVGDLLGISEFVSVKSKLRVVTADPTDDIFLNLALDGRADVIVSSDHHLRDLKIFNEIPIISVRKFLTY
jgi:uncharacterized protein